jgi:sarcosine oxidase subunit gamma
VTAETSFTEPATILRRRSPLASFADRLAASPLDVVEEPFRRQLLLRLDPTSSAALDVEDVLGAPLPVANRAANPTDRRTVVWLGPDEWLVTDDGEPADLATRLADLVQPIAGAVTDVSAQRTTLRLRGRYARAVLAKGCSVDLHPRVAQPGLAVQTTIAHAGVILVVLGSGAQDHHHQLDCRVLVRSTFAPYLADWLLDAALEYVS